MGRYVTLPLHGIANFYRGLSVATPSIVVRLVSPIGSPAILPTDFALVHSRNELQLAAEGNVNAVLIVGDDGLEHLPDAAGLPRLVSVPGKFSYFSAGDIIRFHPHSGRFRTLYRRASEH